MVRAVGSLMLAAVLAGCGTSVGTPAASPSSSTTARETPTSVPSESPGPPSPSARADAWAEVPLGGGGLSGLNCTTGSCLAEVRPWRTGFIGVGSVDGTPTAWTSVDGKTWDQPVQLPPAADGTPGGVFDVIEGGPGLIAVGSDIGGSQCAATEPIALASTEEIAIRAVVWTSSDGRTWTRVPDGQVFNLAQMTRVVRFGPAFVALGSATRACVNRGISWTSLDGRHWTANLVRTFDNGGPNDAAEQGGRLVAVGQVGCAAGGSCAGAAWSSPDGSSWTKAAAGIPNSYGLGSVTGGPSGLVATGADKNGAAHIWTTTEGTTWREAPAPGPGQLGPVVAVGAGYLIAGDDAIWASTDGATWSNVIGSSIADHVTFSFIAHGLAATIAFGTLDDGTIVEWAAPA